MSRTVEQLGTLDASVGAEYVAAGRYPLRAGLFTDHAASPGKAGVANTARIDRYGASASVGLQTANTSSSIGANVSYGKGHDLVPDNLDFTQPKNTKATQRLLYLFVATSYEF